MTEPDWLLAPKWAEWFAVDDDGEAWWYETKPYIKPIKFSGWTEQIYVHTTVARLKGGIPNPKERPVLALPWFLSFTLEYIENRYCTFENLKMALDMGGTLGLGTFRPQFGRYALSRFDRA